MEAFESIVKYHFESLGYIATTDLIIPTRGMHKKIRAGFGLKPTEPAVKIDLVAIRKEEVVICEIKSYFDSHGVTFKKVFGGVSSNRPIRLFSSYKYSKFIFNHVAGNIAGSFFKNDKKRYKFGLAVGKFSSRKERDRISNEFKNNKSWMLITPEDISRTLLISLQKKGYIDHPAIAAIKCLNQAKIISKKDLRKLN